MREGNNFKKLKQNQASQKKHRENVRNKLESAKEKNPELAAILKSKKGPGKPRIEDKQPDLLKTIVDLVTCGSAADGRRRTDVLRSCRRLDDLHEQLKNLGYSLSRSATYLRLIPRRFNTEEGKRHVKTVPVK